MSSPHYYSHSYEGQYIATTTIAVIIGFAVIPWLLFGVALAIGSKITGGSAIKTFFGYIFSTFAIVGLIVATGFGIHYIMTRSKKSNKYNA